MSILTEKFNCFVDDLYARCFPCRARRVKRHGNIEWYLNGKLHRKGGPAIERKSGRKEWYFNGSLHREGGPAIESTDGGKQWFFNGQLHREGGPAVEWASGRKEWRRNGDLHREDGPAVEAADGTEEWYFKGDLLTAEEFQSLIIDAKQKAFKAAIDTAIADLNKGVVARPVRLIFKGGA